jgi:hypothetical protein
LLCAPWGDEPRTQHPGANRSRAQKRYVDHAKIAEIYAAVGETDGAFNALEHAYIDRSQPLLLVWFVPEFTSLQGVARVWESAH